MYSNSSTSPPPLQHPVPTHPAYIPEPPSTPVSPEGYQRYTSSPQPSNLSTVLGVSPNVPSYSNPTSKQNAYTSPFQHHHHQPHPSQHAHQSHVPPSNIPTTNFAGWPMNEATAQFGLQLGHSAVAAGQDYVQKNVRTTFRHLLFFSLSYSHPQLGGIVLVPMLKHHFNVSNSYVIKKIQLVLFPWFHKPWSRKLRRTEQGQTEWQPPRNDINSPDLYIPRSSSSFPFLFSVSFLL